MTATERTQCSHSQSMAYLTQVQDNCAAVLGGGRQGLVCCARVEKMSMNQSHQSHANAADSKKIPKTYQRSRPWKNPKDRPPKSKTYLQRQRHTKTKAYQDQGIPRPRRTERQAGSSERKITVWQSCWDIRQPSCILVKDIPANLWHRV